MKKISMAVLLAVFLVSGCGTTSYIVNSWKAPGVATSAFKKIVVVGLIREADWSVREKMEQHIAEDLRAMGYDAFCSCDQYNPKAFQGLTETQAIDKLRGSGVDAVLTIVLLDKAREQYYVPGRVYYSPYYVYHNRFWGYYRTMYDRVYSPGYYVTSTKYFWESNLYDIKGDQLVYSAQSQTFDPSSMESLGHEYGKMIVKDMTAKRILVDQKTIQLKGM